MTSRASRSRSQSRRNSPAPEKIQKSEEDIFDEDLSDVKMNGRTSGNSDSDVEILDLTEDTFEEQVNKSVKQTTKSDAPGAHADKSEPLDMLNCTSCGKDIHPKFPQRCHQHPDLKVLICKVCLDYYESGEITQDEDGLDEQCRWCGEGGKLFGCDHCHNAFCKSCIKRNLGKDELSKVESEGEWKCYMCENKPIESLVNKCDELIKRKESKQNGAKPAFSETYKCTSCGKQINPNKTGSVARHPDLKVLICKKCYKYFKSGEITQDSKGFDEQCRWCGEGGNLFGCDVCTNAFCKTCIVRNLGREQIFSIKNPKGGKWKCYMCKPNTIDDLRVQCRNLIRKLKGKEPIIENNENTDKHKQSDKESEPEAEENLSVTNSYSRRKKKDKESDEESETEEKLPVKKSKSKNKKKNRDSDDESETEEKLPVKKSRSGSRKKNKNSDDESEMEEKLPVKKSRNKKKNKNSEDESEMEEKLPVKRSRSRKKNKDSDDESESEEKLPVKKSRSRKKNKDWDDESETEEKLPVRKSRSRNRKKNRNSDEESETEEKLPVKKSKSRNKKKDRDSDEESEAEEKPVTKENSRHRKNKDSDEESEIEEKLSVKKSKTRSRKKNRDSDKESETEDISDDNSRSKHKRRSKTEEKGTKDDQDFGEKKLDKKSRSSEHKSNKHHTSHGADKISSKSRANRLSEDLEWDVTVDNLQSVVKKIQSVTSSFSIMLSTIQKQLNRYNGEESSSEEEKDTPIHPKKSLKSFKTGWGWFVESTGQILSGKIHKKLDGDEVSDKNDKNSMGDGKKQKSKTKNKIINSEEIKNDVEDEGDKQKNVNKNDDSDSDFVAGTPVEKTDKKPKSDKLPSEASNVENAEIMDDETTSGKTDKPDDDGENAAAKLELLREMAEELVELAEEHDMDTQDEKANDEVDLGDCSVPETGSDESKENKKLNKEDEIEDILNRDTDDHNDEKLDEKHAEDDESTKLIESDVESLPSNSNSDTSHSSDSSFEDASGQRRKKRKHKLKDQDDKSNEKRSSKKKKDRRSKREKCENKKLSENANDSDDENSKKTKKDSDDNKNKGKRTRSSSHNMEENKKDNSRKKKEDSSKKEKKGSAKNKESSEVKNDSDSSNYDSDLDAEIDKLAKMPKLRKSNKNIESEDNDDIDDEQKEKKIKKKKEKGSKKEKKETDMCSTDDEEDKSEDEDEDTEEEEDKQKSDDDVQDIEDENELAKKALLEELNEDDSDNANSDKMPDSSSDSDVVTPKKKTVIKKKDTKNSSDDNTNNSDSDSDSGPTKKKQWNSKLLNAKISESDSDSDSDVLHTPKKSMKKRKRKDSSSDNTDNDKSSDSTEDLSDDSNRGKKKKGRKKGKKATKKTEGKGKKRRRIKKVSSSSDGSGSGNGSEAEEKGSGDDDEATTPGGHGKRRKIRKILSKKKLKDETKAAVQAEEERRKRIAERQKEFNKIVQIADDSSPTKCPITTQLVLEMDKEKKPLIQVHSNLIRKLKPHQVEAVQFMWDCCCESLERMEDEEGGGCIIAHCMGLGKTLSVISFVFTMMEHEELTKISKVLIICPLNTVLNWQNEFLVWLEDIEMEDDFLVHELSSVKTSWARAKSLEEWQKDGGIMIMGYEMFRNLSQGSHVKGKKLKTIFRNALLDPGPDLVVCDEGHILKNDSTATSKATNMVKTKRRIVLTGTPLQNNLEEYHCMVNFVKPSLLGTRKEFSNMFAAPIINGQCSNSTAFDVKVMKKRAHILHEKLAGCVQRKDYSALTKFLPNKFEFVLAVRLAKKQIQLYRTYLELRGGSNRTMGSGASLFADYQMLMRIWTHPWVLKLSEIRAQSRAKCDDSEGSFIDDGDSLTEEESMSGLTSSSEDDKLALTDDSDGPKRKKRKSKEDRDDKAKKDEVVKKWITRSRGLDEDGAGPSNAEVINIEEENKPVTDEWWAEHVKEEDKETLEISGKLVLLFEILRMCEDIGDKILIFSQSLLSLDIIEDFLEQIDTKYKEEMKEKAKKKDEKKKKKGEEDTDEEEKMDLLDETNFGKSWTKGVDYFRMDGSTNAVNRKKWQNIFNDENDFRARLFLISTKAGSLGVNLVGANRVIIFDASWNPSHDVQSIFRVYRFGQTKPCYVYRFLAQGTMEEKIYERQVTKQSLSQRVVDEHQIERHFDSADLQELYTFTPDDLDDPNRKERPTPVLPKDNLLAELLKTQKQWIVGYHEHDSLLENKEDETLTEDERKAAWKEYEDEKKGINMRVQQGQFNLNFMQQNNMMNSLMGSGAGAFGGMLANMGMQNMPLLQYMSPNDMVSIVREVNAKFPNLPPDMLQQKCQMVLRQVLQFRIMQKQEQEQKEMARFQAEQRARQLGAQMMQPTGQPSLLRAAMMSGQNLPDSNRMIAQPYPAITATPVTSNSSPTASAALTAVAERNKKKS